MRSHSVKKSTQKWVDTQEFVGVGYYGNDCPNLWEVLDLYVESEQEGDSFEDTLEENFPDHFEDIEVISVKKETKPMIHKQIKYFRDCQHKLVFVAGELME